MSSAKKKSSIDIDIYSHLTAARNYLRKLDDFYARAAAAVGAALEKGESYGRTREPQRKLTRPATDPFAARVYLFTDIGCASACLDFADVLRRLPRVIQIGFPTYADTNYIDNTSQLLPSGLAYLSYSLKVYRHRARRNNEWYEPQILWPGGEVTDESIAAWVRTLRGALIRGR